MAGLTRYAAHPASDHAQHPSQCSCPLLYAVLAQLPIALRSSSGEGADASACAIHLGHRQALAFLGTHFGRRAYPLRDMKRCCAHARLIRLSCLGESKDLATSGTAWGLFSHRGHETPPGRVSNSHCRRRLQGVLRSGPWARCLGPARGGRVDPGGGALTVESAPPAAAPLRSSL
jgi:hypothetical protein